ncbi:hypothetical protein [Cereibacter azotoformans]|uniref:hypothetical protein n=1 Tax=Cereibacter azotoformans TaxID=43057 RepID=UPI000C6CEC23|nr:hypothetical protein [Cereibacter azotoformans]
MFPLRSRSAPLVALALVAPVLLLPGCSEAQPAGRTPVVVVDRPLGLPAAPPIRHRAPDGWGRPYPPPPVCGNDRRPGMPCVRGIQRPPSAWELPGACLFRSRDGRAAYDARCLYRHGYHGS